LALSQDHKSPEAEHWGSPFAHGPFYHVSVFPFDAKSLKVMGPAQGANFRLFGGRKTFGAL
jgi:hypothetical protein